MSLSDLRSITITDFRSINGQVTIPLDAPIVLIHGVNGAGKSSVLSAIELALTGGVAGLVREESAQPRYLVHRGRPQAEVDLHYTFDGVKGNTRVSIAGSDGSSTGTPALPVADRKTFTERCYLAQSTVGRLLEIYQHLGAGESPLTRFVKDLLGLDKLEALIDGLYPAGDIRRLRHIVPTLTIAEDELKRLSQIQGTLSQNISDLDRLMEEKRHHLARAWAQLIGQDELNRLEQLSTSQLLDIKLSPDQTRVTWETLEALRQEIAGLRVRAETISSTERLEIESVEAEASAAATALATWRGTTGAVLNDLLDRLTDLYPDLPAFSPRPAFAFAAAQEHWRRENERVLSILERDGAASREIAVLGEQLRKVEERLHRLSVALTDRPDRLLELTSTLTQLLPHIDGPTCPVCQRDFSEVSSTRLDEFLASHLASMNSEAKRLKEIAESIRGAREDRARLASLIDETNRALQTPESRLEARRLEADLDEIGQGLAALAPRIAEGDALTEAERSAREALLACRNVTSQSAEVRQAATRVAVRLGVSMGEYDSLERLLERVTSAVESHLARSKSDATARAIVLSLQNELRDISTTKQKRSEELKSINVDRAEHEEALSNFEARRGLARLLAAEAELARTRVVREVFNHSLNQLWRDLFVRLVPSEPFVPAFRVVTGKTGGVAAELETQHRDGQPGGNPSFMLSAGNLNTGAVTLFIALHLSIDPKLPWLILDDPVQSMDEVHIAQFAALLRTLSKQQGRKLIVAVHERSLFDYLALELSPAFPGDKLITVELSRPDTGRTEINPEFRVWKEDRALAAV